MSNISVPSRFACLKIEGDEEIPTKHEKRSTKKAVVKAVIDKPKSNENKKVNSKQSTKKLKKNTTEKQWEEWKQKDSELVTGHFEKDLQNAILLSKLDYEEKKDLYKQAENDNRKPTEKKKKKTMSLEEFLGTINGNTKDDNADAKPVKDKENFFAEVGTKLKEELDREKIIEDRKIREENIEEIISSSQFQEKLRVERDKNEKLEKEMEALKLEVADTKYKNKILCKVLGHGERIAKGVISPFSALKIHNQYMYLECICYLVRDKADVLLELERLNAVKCELTDEVAKLHVLLERERSKVAALAAATVKGKEKRQKKHT